MKTTAKVLPSLAFALYLCALAPQAISAESCCTNLATQQRQDLAFGKLGAEFIKAFWRANPEAAITAGKYDAAAELHIPDRHSRARQLAFWNTWALRLDDIDPQKLPPKQYSDYAVLQNHAKSSLWHLVTLREFEWNPAEYNISSGFDAILRTDYAPIETRLRSLLKRLGKVPAYYMAARASIVNPTREHTELAIRQNTGALDWLNELEQTVRKSALSNQEKGLYGRRLLAARHAIKDYIDWLGKLDNPTPRSFRLGAELYEAKFAADIQSGFSAKELYQRAQEAKESLLLKMNALADELWPKYLPEVAKPKDRAKKIGMIIDNLSSNHIARADLFAEVRRQIPHLHEWVLQHDLIGIDPGKPLIVRETPQYQRGVAAAGIEAPGPLRPQGQTYYNVDPLTEATPAEAESNLREYNYWMLQILNIHEAIPGHYTQMIHANKSPSLIKRLFRNDAMIEGWAVYGERMMLESGYGGNTPEMWLMYSKWNLRSVCNVILDYSTHVLGMSQADAMQLLTKEAFQTETEASEKWRRVQLTSVQLASYFSGYSEIMELREQRKQALGEKFNLKAFHEEFLSHGSAPIKVIKQLMLVK